MRKLTLNLLVTLAALMTTAAMAQQKPSAYPAKGQSAQQQAADDSACLAWAQQSTGINPAAVAATPVAPSGPHGERAVGAVRGAAAGAVIGGVTGSASKGAGVGAAAGVVAGGARSRRNQAAQVQQGNAAKSQAMETYYRAYGACMQGRGYTVH